MPKAVQHEPTPIDTASSMPTAFRTLLKTQSGKCRFTRLRYPEEKQPA
jgi:hypothetical protein